LTDSPNYRFNVIVFVILILLVSVVYLLVPLPTALNNLLILIPFYYVIDGLHTNAIDIAWSVNRLTHDVLFFAQMALLYLWIFKLYDKMKFTFYDFNKKRQMT